MTAAITDSSGEALFTTTVPHGLSVNDVVYVQSYVEDYNGFLYVESVPGIDSFTLSQYEGGDPIVYVRDIEATVNVASSVAWSCVHLPIVYELTSDLYPENSINTLCTISSSSNDDGLTNINLSAPLGTFEELDFIEVKGATSEEVNGVWQILDKVSTSDVTINIPYNSQYSFSGGTAQLYYSNYHILVRVYAGVWQDHPWSSKKPFELAATLKLIPDSNNKVRFSINEILKNYVKLNNNLVLGTLPNNIDFWVGYYISVAESYDRSNAYSIGQYIGDFTTDTFNGFAVQAKLPFKNIYSGHLSEFVMKPGYLGKFLTLFLVPVLFSGCEECYQDISFILDTTNETSLAELNSGTNYDAGSGTKSWSISSTPNVELEEFEESYNYRIEIDGGVADQSYQFDVTYQITKIFAPGFDVRPTYYLYDETLTQSVSVLGAIESGDGSHFESVELTPSFVPAYFAVSVEVTCCFGVKINWQINSVILSVGSNTVLDEYFLRKIYLTDGVAQDTIDTQIDNFDSGVYRAEISADCSNGYDQLVAYIFGTTGVYDDEIIVSEIKTISINCDCSEFNLRLCWLNNLGGFDYWNFTAGKEPQTEIEDTGSKSKNVFPSFPTSYGEYADTLDREQTYRKSFKKILVRSQHVTQEQLEAISYIKSSPLVQIINSRTDRRTVIVDSDSFVRYREYEDKEYNIQFTISYTDDNPSQTA